MRAVARAMSARGAAVYRREWGSFGKASAIRDTVLCAQPQRGWSASLAPPSEDACERCGTATLLLLTQV